MDPGPKPQGMSDLTDDEIWRVAEQRAIDEGALEPQGMGEGMAANWMSSQQGIRWAASPRAQSRLHQWTIEILRAWGYKVV